MQEVIEKEQDSSVIMNADSIMNAAVEKAGDILCTKPQIAEIILRQLLKCDPEHLSGLQLLGLCKHRMGDNEEAVEIIQTALDLDPTNADNYNNLGLAYAGMNHYDRSIEAISKAIELKPEQFLFKNNLALQHRAIGDYDSAVRHMRDAIETSEKPQLWLNLGGIYGEMKEIDKAGECFQKALDLDPEYPAAHVDMAFVHHLKGDWEAGFAEYEWRFWYYPQMRFYLNSFDNDKLWHGTEELTGKRIIVYGEQGMGDIIMFSRYTKDLKALGAHVIMHVPQCMAELVKRVEGVDEVNTKDIFSDTGESLPAYDYQISLMSAPHLLRKKDISGDAYIKPATNAFRDYIKEEHPKTFNVGIAWAGNPAHPHDQRRSIQLKNFKSLQEVSGVKLFSLQMDLRKRQYGATYRSVSPKGANVKDACTNRFQAEKGVVDYCEDCEDMRLTDLTAMIQSFEDTATILAGLDLVVCCDTATGHLAGAMGIPVWLLIPYNPDWRWLMEGSVTPWYNSMKLFRQSERDNWAEVMERVAKELNEAVLQDK